MLRGPWPSCGMPTCPLRPPHACLPTRPRLPHPFRALGRECYAIVEVYADAVHIKGVDTFASEHWLLPPLPAANGATEQRPAAAAGAAVQA